MKTQTPQQYQAELLKDQQEIHLHKTKTIKEIKNSGLNEFLCKKTTVVKENIVHNSIWKKIKNILKF